MTRLIIARHGNTFDQDETPRRVGARTDIPLVESGRSQAVKIGRYLRDNNILPDRIYCSGLIRTKETASIAMLEAGINYEIQPLDIFNEIDYGPDENRTEAEVEARIGREAIEAWNNSAIVPPGWLADPERMINEWKSFASTIKEECEGKNVLVVTSNGVARFAPRIMPDNEFAKFSRDYKLKISTGALCVFLFINNGWRLETWNLKP